MKNNLLVGVLFLVVACTNDASSSIPEQIEKVEEFDVAYTPPIDGDAEMAKMDIYYVPDGKPKRLMLFVHGGSWVGGDKNNLRTTDALVQWFLDRDFVVVAPNFRLASPMGATQEVTYKEQATDIAHALSWLSKNGANYGITESEVILMGFSSGAHLVPLISTDQSYLNAVGLTLDHIAGFISLDVHVYDVSLALELMKGSEIQQNIPFIEFLFGETEEEQLAASPLSYAAGIAVPSSLIISAEPSSVPGKHGYITAQTAQNYVEQLLLLGHRATWIHYDNETHSSLVLDFGITGDKPTEAVAEFLDSL